jgi:hypothetical protein
MLSWKTRVLGALGGAGLLAMLGCGGGSPNTNGNGVGGQPQPVAGHPRLWVNEAMVADLQSRATAANPFYAQGLQKVAEDYKMMMDSGQIPSASNDCADSSGLGGIICEWPMQVFGLMSVVDPDPAERDDYGRRARKLLMIIVELAKQGTLEGDPIRDPSFPVRDRAHYGEAFGLTVDWVYQFLTDSDKADIRQVFLTWCDADVNAATTTDNHPTPVGVFNDPQLLADKVAVRFAGNNYFTSHARNMGLMAMSFDPADDPDGKLGAYAQNATGAFLYMTDALLRGDAKGGLLPEGTDYDTDTSLNIGGLMLALHTAGLDDPTKLGQQVQMSSNPFYAAQPDAYVQQLAPAPVSAADEDYLGKFSSYTSFGDMETFVPYSDATQDYIAGFAPVGLIAKDTGDKATYDKIRWVQNNMPPGGLANVIDRANSDYVPLGPMFYFLLMDPKDDGGTDPRPALGTDYWSPGLNFMFARTGWGPAESYFSWSLEWTGMDHRHADDNHFSFWRKGEWITMERSGYAGVFFTGPMHNNVAVQNTPPKDASDDLTQSFYSTGSQWVYEGAGDGTVVGHSVTADYAYGLGDATAMHNSTDQGSTAVTHLSRSILWLKPDHVITYDRVATKTEGLFKRVYLQLPSAPQVKGLTASAKTAGGQGVFYASLLPKNAVLSNDAPPSDMQSQGAPMTDRLHIEAPDMPAAVAFLGVLQGADSGVKADPTTLVQSTAGASFDGVVVKGAAVLFPADIGAAFTTVTFTLPSSVTRRYVTGLTANATYTVTMVPAGSSVAVTVAPGSGTTADEAGVLSF